MKEDILQVNNIWDSLNGKTNPARLVTIARHDRSDAHEYGRLRCGLSDA